MPAKRGRALLDEIESASCPDSPAMWWLGRAGFALKYKSAIVYIDPYRPPFDPREVTHAGLVLCTHRHPGHLDPETAPAILEASPRARLVIPKSAAEHAHSLLIPYHRMVTTDSGLRVEYLDDRVYAAPSAHPELDWTPLGGYPYLGYLVRFGANTIYHAGDCVPYESLAARLRPYNVTVALLGVSGRPANFDAAEAAQLAADIGARWLVPMHYAGEEGAGRFIEHMLFHRPEQRFKVFECGEMWTLPEDDA
ncbi:MAG: MBL fold metallo-hydrolase [Bryobacteraceae bacterium]